MVATLTPKPKGPSSFDVVARKKDGVLVLRETTATGKKLNILSIDAESGLVLRGNNDGSILPLDENGNVFVTD
jgi:hypothetical protein